MSTGNPGSLWDTASLMTLASSQQTVAYLRTPGVLRDPGWVRMIPAELSRLHSLKPPTPHAGQAHRLAIGWLGTPLPELPGEEEAVLQLRDRIAAGVGHPREHLGEAQSIVVAKRVGATFVSDDGGAREEACVEKVRSVSIHGLLGLHVAAGKLTAAAGDALVADLARGGRAPAGVSLDMNSLITSGHIRLP